MEDRPTVYFFQGQYSAYLVIVLAMAPVLPDDILYLICTQLWQKRDFDTLYQSAISGRRLAYPALANIYRYQLTMALLFRLHILRTWQYARCCTRH